MHDAKANPRGSEALRLAWLDAREQGSRQLLALVVRCRDGRFSIPEIDGYVAEQLASARALLKRARSSGSMSLQTLRVHERTIELAEAAERSANGRDMNPILVRALELAIRLASGVRKQTDS